MRESITIGDQVFVYDEAAGWIDKKTKIPADKGIVHLLERVSPELSEFEQETPEAPKKKLRVRIDKTVDPVTIAGQKFVYDKNSQSWIDAKTKQKAPEHLQKLLSSVSSPVQSIATDEVTQALGIAAKPNPAERDAKRVRGETDIGLNRVIVKMIDHLASIDSSLKAKLKFKKKYDAINAANQREAVIENAVDERSQELTAEQKEQLENAEKQNDATPVEKMALAGLAIGAIALMWEPVTNIIKEYGKNLNDIGQFVSGFVEKINGVFDFLLDPLGDSQDSKSPVGTTPSPSGGGQSSQVTPEPTSDQAPPPQVSSDDGPSVAAPLIAGAAVVGTAAVATRVPNARGRVSPPTRPLPESRPPVTSAPTGTRMSRMTQAVRNVAAPVMRSPAGRIAPIALGVIGAAAVGSYLIGGDSSGDAAPEPQTGSPQTSGGSGQQDSGGNQDSQRQASSVPGVVYTEGDRNTGPGYTIRGARDQSGRPVVFSKEGAEAFARMMADSGGVVKPSDIASSKRSPAKNAAVDGATHSPHLRGVAMDIHGASNNWIRRNGARYGWNAHDYSGTHGGHFIFGGRGMAPSGPSGVMATAVAAVEELTAPAITAMVGGLKKFIRTDTEFRDVAQIAPEANQIANAARERLAAKIEARSAPPPPAPSMTVIADRQNANPDPAGTVQTMPERDDRAVINQYLQYFGMNNTRAPTASSMTIA